MILLAVCAIVTACSTDDTAEVQTGEGVAAESSTTASLPESPTSTDSSNRPNPSAESNAALSNLNEPDGQLGSLCWARWEIARLYLQATAIFAAEPDRAASAAKELAGTLPQVLEPIRNAEVADGAVTTFRDHLAASVETASTQVNVESEPSQITAVATEQFNFDSYPGIEAYVAAANESPVCSNP